MPEPAESLGGFGVFRPTAVAPDRAPKNACRKTYFRDRFSAAAGSIGCS